MAVYIKPIQYLPVFNANNYEFQDNPVTFQEGDKRYLLKTALNLIASISAGSTTIRLTTNNIDSQGAIAGYSTTGVLQSNIIEFLGNQINFNILGTRALEMTPTGLFVREGSELGQAWYKVVPTKLIPQRAIDLFTQYATNNNYNYTSIVYNRENTRFTIVSDTGGATDRAASRALSTISYTQSTTTLGLAYKRVIWCAEYQLHIAFSSSGNATDIMTSSPTVAVWTHRTTGAGNLFRDICFSPDLGVTSLVGWTTLGNNAFMHSTDGITWTKSTYSGNPDINSVCWNPQQARFVALEIDQSWFSSNGINWLPNGFQSGPPLIINSVIWIQQLQIYVASGAFGIIFYSYDGVNWVSTVTPVVTDCYRIAWAPEFGMIAAITATNIVYSWDGINWFLSPMVAPAGVNFNDIIWANEISQFWIAGGNNPNNNTFFSRSVGRWNYPN